MMNDLWKRDTDWFVSWFNTQAYHVLYENRDQEEAIRLASAFSEKLWDGELKELLDLGCGAGRHAAAFANRGHTVMGIDLSENSIEAAKSSYLGSNAPVFQVGDMRLLSTYFPKSSFDAVTSLFTSMGYFHDEEDLRKTLRGIDQVLKSGGMFILDYLNLPRVVSNLTQQETVSKGAYRFEIHRRVCDGWIEKSIRYQDENGLKQHHVERVRAWSEHQWADAFHSMGWKVQSAFGDYALNNLKEDSPRCILVAQK
jgi:SAM-dependent methyltransferase